ncbi:toxin TcdB middle/N-terminal domain-containing protein, partial [Labrys sp. 22185]|uniref:toxin TcdB middle/N-terminal domain-containing protein n=1 Tax=Labrys sp. 22185 TaxID=3453888 RepID=UPI003F8717A2
GDDPLKAIASASALATKAEPASFNGSFTQSVSIAVPAYHGLEPKVSLRYDSNAGARAGGYWAGLAGVGFSLSGLSDITRSSAVGGTPRYADTDEFVLDGDRLVACTAGMTSPACTTGAAGDGVSYYATRVESFVRVKRIVSGTTTSWEVAARDGTVSSYVSPASVPGWYTNGAAPSSDAQLRDDTRWLLRKVTDTHGNEVVYDYACVDDPICWPASISYNGTRIAFNLEATSGAARLSQATGKSIATLDRRIASIDITTANNRVRGYNLDYELSPATGTSRLTAVTQFGRDASLSQNRLSGGTSLPPTTFGWSGVPITEQAWVKGNNLALKYSYVPIDSKSGYSERFVDINSDSVPDKATSGWQDTEERTGGGKDPIVILHKRCYSSSLTEATNRTRPARSINVGGGCVYIDPNPPMGTTSVKGASLAGDHNSDGRPDYISTVSSTTRTWNGNNTGVVVTNKTTRSFVLSRSDGTYESRALGSVTGSNPLLPGWGTPLDLNGDGVKEFVVTYAVANGVYRKIESLTGAAAIDEPVPSSVRQQLIAGRQWTELDYVDLNGDGKSDVYIVTGVNGVLRVTYAYSTGIGFTPLQTFEAPGTLLTAVTHGPGAGQFPTDRSYQSLSRGQVLAIDVNGDGKTDLVALEMNPTGGADIGVFLSTGNGFEHQTWAQGIMLSGGCAQGVSTGGGGMVAAGDGLICLPRVLSGDFDGDGRQDLVINANVAVNPPPDDIPNSSATMFLSRAGVGPGGEGGFVAIPGQLPSIAYVADLDEDGRDDLIEGALRSPAGASRGFIIYRSGDNYTLNTAFPDLLTSVKGPLGASASIAYKPSSSYPWPEVRPAGSALPSILQTVSSVTRNDGRGTVGTTDYSYSNALYNAAERRFLGFGMGVALLPANAGETVRPRIDYTFDQSLATVGKVLKTAYSTQDSATVLARESESWSVMTTAGLQANWPPATGTVPALTLPYTAFNTSSEKQELQNATVPESSTSVPACKQYSGGFFPGWKDVTCSPTQACPVTTSTFTCTLVTTTIPEHIDTVTRRSSVSRTYDAYGNVTLLLENGNADVTGDER